MPVITELAANIIKPLHEAKSSLVILYFEILMKTPGLELITFYEKGHAKTRILSSRSRLVGREIS